MEQLQLIDWGILSALSLPLLLPLGTGLVVTLLAPFLHKKFSWIPFFLSFLSLFAAFLVTWKYWLTGLSLSMGMLSFDRLSYSFDMLFLLSSMLVLFISKSNLTQESIQRGEYYALLLFALVGGMLIAHSGDLIILFLGLEMASLAAYILTGMKGESIRSFEASLKYFILGSFASGFLIYGIALAYGAAGSTSFAALQQITIPPKEPTLVLLAFAMLLIGAGFKIAAVPFHLWSPDVYEGAPTPVTAFMASVIKSAGFAALIRIGLALGQIGQIPWVSTLWVLSALTMTVGNLVALRQTNIKRMLAYSSIAHAGYALVGVTASFQNHSFSESTIGAVIFYLFAYSFMTIGAFAIVVAIGRRGDEAEELSDYSGLSKKHPVLAAAMTLFLLSLTGIPPTIGFMGKFYLFSGAIEAGLYGLVIVGVLNSVVSAYYYLGPIVKMYFLPEKEYRLPPLSYSLITAVVLCLFAVVYLGIFPSDIFLMARESVRELVF